MELLPEGIQQLIGGLFNHEDPISMAANMKRRSELFTRNLFLCVCLAKNEQ
jgi:hypothetical protein